MIGVSLGEGREEGREEGRLLSLRDALGSVLASRGFSLTTDHRRTSAAADIETPRRWLVQAVTATTADEALR